MKEHNANKRLSLIFTIVIIAVTLVFVGAAVFLQLTSGEGKDPGQSNSESIYDENAQRIISDKGVEKSDSFAYSINGKPYFKNGSAQGTLFIENPATNANYMGVVIELEETGEEIYRSKMIQPNFKIEQAKLSVKLKTGVYPAIATFTAYDRNFEEVTSAEQPITIYIKTKPE